MFNNNRLTHTKMTRIHDMDMEDTDISVNPKKMEPRSENIPKFDILLEDDDKKEGYCGGGRASQKQRLEFDKQAMVMVYLLCMDYSSAPLQLLFLWAAVTGAKLPLPARHEDNNLVDIDLRKYAQETSKPEESAVDVSSSRSKTEEKTKDLEDEEEELSVENCDTDLDLHEDGNVIEPNSLGLDSLGDSLDPGGGSSKDSENDDKNGRSPPQEGDSTNGSSSQEGGGNGETGGAGGSGEGGGEDGDEEIAARTTRSQAKQRRKEKKKKARQGPGAKSSRSGKRSTRKDRKNRKKKRVGGKQKHHILQRRHRTSWIPFSTLVARPPDVAFAFHGHSQSDEEDETPDESEATEGSPPPTSILTPPCQPMQMHPASSDDKIGGGFPVQCEEKLLTSQQAEGTREVTPVVSEEVNPTSSVSPAYQWSTNGLGGGPPIPCSDNTSSASQPRRSATVAVPPPRQDSLADLDNPQVLTAAPLIRMRTRATIWTQSELAVKEARIVAEWEENRRLRRRQSCQVCQLRRFTFCCMPCCHLLCNDCIRERVICPKCRKTIEQRQQVFMQ